ncbi:MAG: MoaD/ThiS family protein [Odoribacter sp.]|nr:MoaD/ThiS family protein [Odoribacter sp.]
MVQSCNENIRIELNFTIIMKVKVLFFGVLSDVTGAGMRFYNEVKSIEHLKLRVTDDYPEIIHYKFSVSLNNELVNGDAELNNNDEVAFLPPFAGG